MNHLYESFHFSDVQTAAEALPWMELNYRQMESGPLAVRVDFQQVDEVTLLGVSLDRRVSGTGRMLPGRMLFLLCTGGSQAHVYDDQPLAPGKVYVRGAGDAGRQDLLAGYQGILFMLPNVLLHRHQRLRPGLGLHSGTVVDISDEDKATLLGLYSEGFVAGAAQRRHLCDSIVTCLCRALTLESVSDFPVALDTKRKLANRVRERLEECAEMTLGDICQELSVSERTLRRAFQEFYGMSPGHYQLTVRLNLVREDLHASPPDRGAVSRIATQHGFWHMGRFSSQYRRLFGEMPSQTLEGSRRQRVWSCPLEP